MLRDYSMNFSPIRGLDPTPDAIVCREEMRCYIDSAFAIIVMQCNNINYIPTQNRKSNLG